MQKEVQELVSREIKASVESRRADINRLHEVAKNALVRAGEMQRALNHQLHCDTHSMHEFETVPGSGMMGSRFEERCKHCGWIHTC